MSAAPKTTLTVAEYLELEELAECRSEYYRGEMFAMAAGSPKHNAIKENLVIELGGRLKGGRCQTFSSDQRVLIEATGLRTYPDIVVVCGEGNYDAIDRNALTNPTAIIEVLSTTTEAYDRGAKFRHYQQIPSLVEYLLVSQDEAVCERYVRQSSGSWVLDSFIGLAAVLEFTFAPVAIPLADVYAGVTLPSAPTPPRQ